MLQEKGRELPGNQMNRNQLGEDVQSAINLLLILQTLVDEDYPERLIYTQLEHSYEFIQNIMLEVCEKSER